MSCRPGPFRQSSRVYRKKDRPGLGLGEVCRIHHLGCFTLRNGVAQRCTARCPMTRRTRSHAYKQMMADRRKQKKKEQTNMDYKKSTTCLELLVLVAHLIFWPRVSLDGAGGGSLRPGGPRPGASAARAGAPRKKLSPWRVDRIKIEYRRRPTNPLEPLRTPKRGSKSEPP